MLKVPRLNAAYGNSMVNVVSATNVPFTMIRLRLAKLKVELKEEESLEARVVVVRPIHLAKTRRVHSPDLFRQRGASHLQAKIMFLRALRGSKVLARMGTNVTIGTLPYALFGKPICARILNVLMPTSNHLRAKANRHRLRNLPDQLQLLLRQEPMAKCKLH